MKRQLMGLLWFVAFWVVFSFVLFLVPALLIARGLPPGASRDQMTEAAADFALQHADAMSMARWAAFLIALLLAVLGTWKGLLPGTKPKSQA